MPDRVARTALCTITVTPLLRWAVIAHAVPPGQPWCAACPRCATPLGPGWNLGALSPRARCGTCQLRLGPPPWTLELVAACSVGVLAASGMTGFRLAAYAWWAVLCLVLALVDLGVQRLPARLCYPAAAGFLVLVGADAQLQHTWNDWLRAALGAIVAAGVLAVCATAMPRLVHWGDVRFALAIGAAATHVGWLALYAAAFLSTLLAAAVGAGLVLARRATLATQLPLGPYLYAGTLVTVVLLACRVS